MTGVDRLQRGRILLTVFFVLILLNTVTLGRQTFMFKTVDLFWLNLSSFSEIYGVWCKIDLYIKSEVWGLLVPSGMSTGAVRRMTV